MRRGNPRQPGSGLHASDTVGAGFDREDAWGDFAAWLVSGVFGETVNSQGLGGAKGYDGEEMRRRDMMRLTRLAPDIVDNVLAGRSNGTAYPRMSEVK
ncbi:hypothetical protein CCP4SC76_2970006 [Gammaproteobacteria bacterium]